MLIVAASLAVLLGGARALAGWADRRVPGVALAFLVAGLAGLVYAQLALVPGGLTWRAVPDAFIAVAAMLLNRS